MRRPAKVFVAIAGMVAAGLAVGSGTLFLTLAGQAGQSQAQEQSQEGDASREEAAPDLPLLPPADPAGRGELPQVVDSEWLDATAEATGIPRRPLQAYVGAAAWTADRMPSCGLGWNTLAAIGQVETNHGRVDGTRIQDSGDVSQPIVGVELSGGSGMRTIEDTDDGELDGDDQYDRAVGPMQFIPHSWAMHGRDGNGDRKADPQNIDDAAMSAAAYLCAGGSLNGSQGWENAVLSYNDSLDYVQAVYDAAQRIVEATGEGSPAPPAVTIPATDEPTADDET
ncbi:Membrane-bound lytic murein transglycosylase B [Brevibacterium sp. Mu109]|uniref:lytic transglycosylase domain-containing protein n=1 Tax=Brevibacterium sp. Mu109 TaxID=1255669 RepID=UPI000C49A971|nr:lytic murein transglycosylase [Brevibacterium sp. Mu109]SMX73980.1 Membrane-bound lytic murein transglycosylase B [Brevibacterium sp. Mu109]